MTIEELAFKDRKNLTQLNEKDLLDIIEFLQIDRKQWIDQFTQTHNDSIEIQEENQELKKQLEEYKDKINWYENFEVNKTIDKLRLKHNTQQKEFIKRLEDKIRTIETTYSQINGNYGLMNEKLEALKEVLQKYKEIIGVEDENKTTI